LYDYKKYFCEKSSQSITVLKFPKLVFCLFLVLIIKICLPHLVLAQESETHATLLAWEQRIRNFMLDRTHDYGGTNYDRGLFRVHINKMSPEHQIDLMTYRFTLIDDYSWIKADRAYRVSMGSLNATHFAMENWIKNDYNFDKRNNLSIKGFQTQDIRANRFMFYLGYDHKFGKKHHVGVKHTLTNEKADLDASFYYRYGNFTDGMMEFNVTLLDWPSNIIEGLAANSRNRYNQRYNVTHKYFNRPELFSVKLISPKSRHLKAEFLAGLQTKSRKKVHDHPDSLQYVDQEWAHYIGALVEYSNQYFTTGLTFQRTFSKLKRNPILSSNYDLKFGNWQIENRAGFYAATRIHKFRLEQWIWYEYNIDRLQGKKVPGDLLARRFKRIPFHYHEKRVKIKSRLLYDPVHSGFKTGLEFHADYVYPQDKAASNGVKSYTFRLAYPIIRNRGERLTYTIGYRFNEHFYLLAGLSYDLDMDKQSGIGRPRATGTPTWFDGGFGRFSISW